MRELFLVAPVSEWSWWINWHLGHLRDFVVEFRWWKKGPCYFVNWANSSEINRFQFTSLSEDSVHIEHLQKHLENTRTSINKGFASLYNRGPWQKKTMKSMRKITYCTWKSLDDTKISFACRNTDYPRAAAQTDASCQPSSLSTNTSIFSSWSFAFRLWSPE